jgi:hypothetical protein
MSSFNRSIRPNRLNIQSESNAQRNLCLQFRQSSSFRKWRKGLSEKAQTKQLRMHIILQKRRATSAGWRESHRDADEQIERSQAN